MKNELKTTFTKEEILANTNSGRDFFKFVFEASGQTLKGGNTGNLKNPFYEDSKNSVSLFKSGNLWMFKDHGNPNIYTGDVFTFAGFYYGLNPQSDFPEILERIAKDLNITNTQRFDRSPNESLHYEESTNSTNTKKANQPIIENGLPFNYWFQFAPKKAMLETLKAFKVFHPKSFKINGKEVCNSLDNPGFLTQVEPRKDAYKVYRPKDKIKHYWINKPNAFPNVYGLDNLPKDGSLLIIAEGLKDAISAQANGFTAIAIDNANTNIPEAIANNLKERFNKVILCLDNDLAGTKAMEREGQRHGFPYLKLPPKINSKEFKGKDLADYFSEGFTAKELEKLLVSNLVEMKSFQPNTRNLNEGFTNVPPFPIEIFPPEISSFIRESKNTLGHIEDYLSAGILFSFSVASGNKFSIQMKKTWIETPIFYMAIIGRSGIGKTSPLKLATRPIEKRDKENWTLYQKEKKVFQEWEKLAQNEKQNSKEVPKPTLKKFFINDITPEKLCTVLEQNPNGLGYYADEFASWFKNFGRYSKGGSESEFWIKTWSKDPIIIDRKTSESIRIENPFISLCGGIQPGVIHQLTNDGRSENGLMERILYFWPDNILKDPWPKEDLQDSILLRYETAIQKVMDYKGSEIHFSSEALSLLYAWQESHVQKCNSNEEEELFGFYSKLETYLIRFSLLLHIMKWAMSDSIKPNETISAQTIESSILLIEYFQMTTQKVLKYVSGNHALTNLPERKRMFYESLPIEFKRKDILDLAEKYQIKTRTLDRFLSDSSYFTLIETGFYKRKFN